MHSAGIPSTDYLQCTLNCFRSKTVTQTTLTFLRKQVAEGVLPESALTERLKHDLLCAERRAESLRKEIAQRGETPCSLKSS